MTKPIDLDELFATLKKLLKKQQSNDKSMKMLQAVQRELNGNGHSEEKILRMATLDILTGLPNRILFDDQLVLELAHAKCNKKKLAVTISRYYCARGSKEGLEKACHDERWQYQFVCNHILPLLRTRLL